MPRIAVTAADLWKTRAKRWRKQNQGVQAEHLSLAERRESSRARAAFWVATAPPRQGPPHPEACQACGLSTHAWCEGCYCRVGGSEEPFSALCRQCDQDKLVCPQCVDSGVSWDQGHRAYVQTHGEETEDSIEISLTPEDPPKRIKLSDLAREMGVPIDQLRADLLGALGCPRSSTS